MRDYDAVDLELLAELADDPRAPNSALADRTGLSRNTIHARMKRLTADGAFLHFDRQISTGPLGRPLNAWITLTVQQMRLAAIVDQLRVIPEVVQAHGLSGPSDVLLLVICRDTDHLFAIDAAILAIPGIERTEIALSMGELIPYRLQQVIRARRGELAQGATNAANG